MTNITRWDLLALCEMSQNGIALIMSLLYILEGEFIISLLILSISMIIILAGVIIM